MLNSADFNSKTARAPAGSPHRGKSSRDKRLMHGRRLGGCQAAETSHTRQEFLSSLLEVLLKISKSFCECLFEHLAPLIVVKVLDIAQMAKIKGNIRIDLSNQDHLAPESVSNTDFVKNICISSCTVTNYNKRSIN